MAGVPSHAELLSRGRQALRDGSYRTAQALFAQAVAQQPRSEEAYFGLAMACAYLGDYEAAVNHFCAALDLNPRHPLASLNLGVVQTLQRRYDAAIAALRKALQVAPTRAEAYYNLGVAYRAKGVTDLAMEAFREAAKRNPQLVEAYLNLGNVLFDLGRYREALHAYEEGLKVCPNAEALQEGVRAAQRMLELKARLEQPAAPAVAAPGVQPAAAGTPGAAVPFSSVVERAEGLAQVLEEATEQEKAARRLLEVLERDLRPAIQGLSHALVHSTAGTAEVELRVKEYRESMDKLQHAREALQERLERLCWLGQRFALTAEKRGR
jgi:tetratricopeptide (TPR) repeat protein